MKVRLMITHRFTLERIAEAFETQIRPEVSGKVVITPGGMSRSRVVALGPPGRVLDKTDDR